MMTGCTADWRGFFAPQFEDIWWQPAGMDWCFNFHYSDIEGANELLIYENDRIQNYGAWMFEEPSTYYVDGYEMNIWQNDDCWDLEIKHILVEDLYACECIIRE